jgi:hypothetical protein
MRLSFPFQEHYHPESTYLEKDPTAQLTRIDAAEQLFPVPLTRITSGPDCAVSSVGFLWDRATVSPSWPGRACTGTPGTATCGFQMISRVTQRHRSDLPACGNSAPNGSDFERSTRARLSGQAHADQPILGDPARPFKRRHADEIL